MNFLQGASVNNISMIVKKPLAFFLRDIINESSYKFAFITHFTGIVFSVFSLYFLSRLIGDAAIPYLKKYGGDYFSFLLIGVALAGYMQAALSSFSGSIRDAQTMGTLEAMLITQTAIPTIILSSSLYNFFITSIRILIYLVFGALAFGLDMGDANLPGALLILGLTVICFSSIGILSASFIMVLKKGDPFNWIFTSASWLLGGIYYPIAVLPEWVQNLSYLLPITHSLEGMRMALLQGYSTSNLFSSIFPLMIFTIIMLPLSIWVFKYSVRIAKLNGSLTQY